MSAFYSVRAARERRQGCRVTVRARDADAKQALWGWGSDKSPSIEFYGRGTGQGAGDGEVWQWQLSPAGVAELRRNLRDQLARPKFYRVTDRENKVAASLLKRLESDSVSQACGDVSRLGKR